MTKNNKKSKNFNYNYKKILQVVTFSLLSLVIIIGSSFGLAKFSNLDSYIKDSQYNISTTIEVDIIDDDTNVVDSSEAANDLLNRMSWYGYSNGQVDIVDEDTLLVSFYLKYPNSTAYISTDYPEDETPYSYLSLTNTNKELLEAYTSLFYRGNVEFRSAFEEPLFEYDSQGNIIFSEPAPQPEPQSVSNNQINESSLKTNDPFDINSWTEITDINDFLGVESDSAPIELIKSAQVVYKNGISYIELTPNEQAYSALIEGINFLATNYDPSSNPYGNAYTIWIGYDVASAIAYKLYPDVMSASGSVTNACFTDSNGNQSDSINSFCEPFLIDYGTVSKEHNPNADTILIPDNLGREHAENSVERINSATQHYTYKINNVFWNTSTSNFVFLKVMLLVLLIIVIISFVYFVWYFGLLGAIIGSSTLLVFFSELAIANLSLIPIGLAFSIAVFVSLIVSITLNQIFLKKLKNNLLNGKSRKDHFNSVSKLFLKSSSLLLIFSLPLMIASLILFKFLSLNILLLIASLLIIDLLTITISYIVLMFMTFLSSNKELKKQTKIFKWDILYGREDRMFTFNTKAFDSFFNSSKFNTFKGAKFSVIFLALIGGIGFIILGSLAISGSAFNSKLNPNDYYRYDIVQVIDQPNLNNEEPVRYYYNTYDSLINGTEDPINYVEGMEQLSKDKDFVKDTISSYTNVYQIQEGYNTSYYTNETVIPDDSQTYDPTTSIVYQYGYTIKAKDKLSSEQIDQINQTLSTKVSSFIIDPYLNGNTEPFTYYYQIVPNDNLNNSTVNSYNAYFNAKIFFIILILIIIVVFFVGLIMTKTSGGTSTVVLITLETLASIGIIGIFYLPISNLLLMIIPILIGISFIMKQIPILDYKNKNNFQKEYAPNHIKTQIDIKHSFDKYDWMIYITSSTMVLFSFLTLVMFNIFALMFFFVTLIFSIGIILNHKFVMPIYFGYIEKWRIQSQHNSFKKDLDNSNNPEFLDEEYIKGINY